MAAAFVFLVKAVCTIHTLAGVLTVSSGFLFIYGQMFWCIMTISVKNIFFVYKETLKAHLN